MLLWPGPGCWHLSHRRGPEVTGCQSWMSPAPSHPIIDPGTFRLNTFLSQFKVANLTDFLIRSRVSQCVISVESLTLYCLLYLFNFLLFCNFVDWPIYFFPNFNFWEGVSFSVYDRLLIITIHTYMLCSQKLDICSVNGLHRKVFALVLCYDQDSVSREWVIGC